VTAAERDATSRRLLALRDAVRELERPEAASATALTADPVLRAAVERWLQIAVEAAIDLALSAVTTRGWTPPDTGREAFRALAAHGLVPEALAERLGQAVGMRNVLVHQYTAVDLELIARAVAEDLGDLREFTALAGAWLAGDSSAEGG